MGYQGSDIGLATSKTLDPGSWTDHGSIGLPKSDAYNLIDPNLFQESDSAPIYMSFGSYWHDIFQTELHAPPIKFSGIAPKNILRNTTANAQVAEGSFQFKWQNYYYLFFSAGACCNQPPNLAKPGDEYRMVVCRSSSITGPYTDKAGKDCVSQNGGTVIMASHDDVYAPGGQGVMYDPDVKKPVIYYHYGEFQIVRRISHRAVADDLLQLNRVLDIKAISSSSASITSIFPPDGRSLPERVKSKLQVQRYGLVLFFICLGLGWRLDLKRNTQGVSGSY